MVNNYTATIGSDTFSGVNFTVDEGRDNMLACMFKESTQDGTWVMGLIDGTTVPSIDRNETWISKSFSTIEAEQTIVFDTIVDGAVSIAALDFVMTAVRKVYGFYIRSTTTNKLWTATGFPLVKDVANGATLSLSYTINLRSPDET